MRRSKYVLLSWKCSISVLSAMAPIRMVPMGIVFEATAIDALRGSHHFMPTARFPASGGNDSLDSIRPDGY